MIHFYFAKLRNFSTYRKVMKLFLLSFVYFFLSFGLPAKKKNSTTELIQPLININNLGAGNTAAIKVWPKVASLPASDVLVLLEAMNQANPLGDNWIRGAISKICELDKTSLPINKIVEFLNNQSNHDEARQMAYEIIKAYRPTIADKLAPSFIDDPAVDLRRISVALMIDRIKDIESEEKKKKLLLTTLTKAREVDQIKEISETLKKMGQDINIIKLMGFLVNWHTAGPFDNKERNGFDQKFQPEEKTELNQKYKSMGETITWSPFSTKEEFGMLDINQQYGEIKEVCAYAQTTFYSKNSKPAHFRIGSKNAWKLWLNGKLLFARDEYHRGKTRVDQFIIEGDLKKGKNLILLKVCQNEQTQSWTKQWEFNFRVTDRTGSAIHNAESESN